MPAHLLISVRSPAEARLAAAAADVIDLKSPAAGPLGAVDAATAAAVADVVGPAPLITAAAGELVDWPRASSRALLGVKAISILKLGPAAAGSPGDWARRWTEAAAEIAAAGKQLAAVAYADHQAAGAPAPQQVVELAIAASAPYCLIDTWDKRAGALLDYLPADRLAELFSAARAAGVQTVAAGSLRAADLPRLPRDAIDVVAIRGAACRGDRAGSLCPQRITQFRQALDAWSGVARPI